MPNAFKKILLAFTTGLLLFSAQLEAVTVTEPQEVKEVVWGEVLFSYYRGDDLDALIRLLAREHQGLLVEHKQTANIFAAGLLIDLGLPVAAQQRLDLMESDELSEQNKSRLAMVLARVYYRLQLYNQTWTLLQSLNENHLDDRDVQRRRLMKAQLLFRNKKYEEASEQLESIRYNGNLQVYAEYNNGITLLQLNDPVAHQRGYEILQSVTEIKPLDQEQYALKDQSILALALEALRVKDSAKAQQLLLGLRMDGMVSNEGLLILGWSFAQSEDYGKALNYWLKLSEMDDLLEPAVQEAWLAVPYAYQKQNDYTSALAGYVRAQDSHTRALEELDQLVANEAWRELMVVEQTAEESFIESSPGFQRQLVGDGEFFELLEQWNQLQRWDSKLQRALVSLDPIKVMLETNEQRFIEKSAQVIARIEEIKNLQLQQQQQEIVETFQTQSSQHVADLMLSEDDLKIWSRLEAASDVASKLPAEKLGDKGEVLRRYKGVGLWKFHRDSDHIRWQAQRNTDALAAEVEQLEQQIVNLEELISRPRQPLPEALARVDAMGVQGAEVTDALTQLKGVYEGKMAARFNLIVKQRRAALKNLAEQANVALARLRFRSLMMIMRPELDEAQADSETTVDETSTSQEQLNEEASLIDLVEELTEEESLKVIDEADSSDSENENTEPPGEPEDESSEDSAEQEQEGDDNE